MAHNELEFQGGSTSSNRPHIMKDRRRPCFVSHRSFTAWLALAFLACPNPRATAADPPKPNIVFILDCLPWAYPHWVGNRFSQESADWFAAFLPVARKHYRLELDWIAAAQNEMGTDLNWIRKNLRPILDARSFAKVKLKAPDDDSEFWQVFDALEKDPDLDRLIGAVGYHYVDGREPWEIDQKGRRDATEKAKRSGKPLWASEDWSQSGGQWGSRGTGRTSGRCRDFTSRATWAKPGFFRACL